VTTRPGQVHFGHQGGEFGELAALVRHLVLGNHDRAIVGGCSQQVRAR
jgi:hypothetical protein